MKSWSTGFWLRAFQALMRASFVLTLISFGVVFGCQNTYAEEATISMEIGTLNNLILVPDMFTSTSQIVSVETTSHAGYTITFETGGNTTDLRLVGSDNVGIPTITLPSGSGTIKSASFKYEYGYSVDGKNFRPVPRVDGSMDIIGSSTIANVGNPDYYTLTYGVKTPEDIPAGTYTRTFVITASVNNSSTCSANHICYDNNGSSDYIMMDDQPVNSNSTVTLSAPEYHRDGYGFLGWNTKHDGSGVTYGPNQDITVGDLSENGMTLYAKWLASSGTLQEWSGCDALPIGSTLALTDSRDGNVYTVTKLVDHECWMTENLRLNFADNAVVINAENTNNPTTGFIAAANAHPVSSTSFCTSDYSSCTDQILYNTDHVTKAEDWSIYSYGSYYNWFTATAGHGVRAITDADGATPGDICPKGWHLPTGQGVRGNLAKLDIALGGTGTNQKSPNTSGLWRSFPVNLIYSGEYIGGTTAETLGVYGDYHASTANMLSRSNNLWLTKGSANTNSNGAYKTRGQTIRCMALNSFTVEFDKNLAGASGTMRPQVITRGTEDTLIPNAFSIADSDTKGYHFLKWNTKADGSGTDYTDEAAVMNLAAVGEKITLYAQWEEYHFADITVNFADIGTSRVEFSSNLYGKRLVTETGQTVKLVIGKQYKLSMDLTTGRIFANWAATHGTINSNTANPTTYIPSEAATITVTTRALDGKLYLQNMTLASCATTPTTAYDIRDEQEYIVQRLDDGKCWMLDNLRLGSDSETLELTTADTNLAPNTEFTLPASSAMTSYTKPQINTGSVDNLPTSTGETGSGKVGVYYNYCAASAGEICSSNSTSNTSYDICPKGWRLPDGDKNNGDLVTLYAAYNNKSLELLPKLSATLSGYINSRSGNILDFNAAGYFWTTTSYNANKSYMMEARKNWFNYASGGVRSNGLSIRCRLK